ncbi:MAG: TolC family protein [Melioribacter sp.]|uniref:TolC family protein n=1 Tax=Melioribacter sp. TaxID=2052167 RepID=UPI003BD802E6
MHRSKILLTLFFIAGILKAQYLEISLRESIELALENSFTVKKYESRLKSKQAEEKKTWGNFLPSVSVEASYTHLNDDMSINLNPIKDAIISLEAASQTELQNIYNILNGLPAFNDAQKSAVRTQIASGLNSLLSPFSMTFKKQDFKTATLVGYQPIFLGGKLLAAKNYASSELKSAELELESVKNQLCYKVADAYFQVILIEEIVKTRQSVLEGIRQHKEDAWKLYKEGLISYNNYLRAEVALADAETNLLNDKNNLELALINFKQLLNIPQNAEIRLTDSLSYNNTDLRIDELKAEAFNKQPLLNIIRTKKDAARQNYNLARSEFLPKLLAFGKYEMYPEYLSSLEPRWAVGLQLNINLFNGFRSYLDLQKASYLESEVEQTMNESFQQINLWITKSYTEANNASERFKKLETDMKLAQENLRQNEKRFLNGMGTSLEVVDARLSLEKVELERTASLYQYYKSLAELFYASGDFDKFFDVWKNQELSHE